MLTATYHNMLNIVNKLFGGLSSNNLKKYENVVKKINNFELEVSRLSDDDLKNIVNQYYPDVRKMLNVCQMNIKITDNQGIPSFDLMLDKQHLYHLITLIK